MKALEQKLRKQLKEIGFRLQKSRVKNTHINNQGGYQIIDNRSFQNTPIYGWNFELSLENVERITTDLKEKSYINN